QTTLAGSRSNTQCSFCASELIEERDSSGETLQPTALIPPDVALCTNCRKELHNPSNRRYEYPFITCTYCGPRYSIIEKLPYDRERTTMQDFIQCMDCAAEYAAPTNSRFHSQTNSCANCGPDLWLSVPEKRKYDTSFTTDTSTWLQQAIKWLRNGKIGAIKGFGGYLLLCDAANGDAVAELRRRKQRPTKPFALLYPSLVDLDKDVIVHSAAKQMLKSAIAPIVLLPKQSQAERHLAINQIAPGLDELGVMLPAAPLLELISVRFGRPLVATSGNISGSPIIATEADAEALLANVADFFLHHNRKILQPQDDSVLRFSRGHNRPIWLRRARGLAPLYFANGGKKDSSVSILAMGSDLKHSFGLYTSGNTFLSPYLGDMATYESQLAADTCRENLLMTTAARPKQVITDAHPQFHSTSTGEQLARRYGAEVYTVQHHQAHFAAILSEHQL
ncbi:MAG: Sua5/YciO/YrdC/YwlC family protein, partial [Bacteroidota bacterium]